MDLLDSALTPQYWGIGGYPPLQYLDAERLASGPATELPSISAVQLYDEYDANEVAADKNYKGKIFAVGGMIDSIDKDALGGIIIRLRSSDRFRPVDAHVKDKSIDVVAKLTKEQVISLICTGDGKIIGRPVLRDCLPSHTWTKSGGAVPLK